MRKSAATAFLTPRDIAIVLMVYSYFGCTIEHVRQKFFPSPGARNACYRRISYLVEEDFLDSSRIPTEHGIGTRYFLTIGKRSRPLVAQALGLGLSGLERTQPSPTLSFAPHHLAVCDFRLSLELAAERSGIPMEWTAERVLRRSPLKVKDEARKSNITLVADGKFDLALPRGEKREFYLEQDMATHHQPRLRTKLRGYLLSAASQSEYKPVLLVCPAPSRQKAIAMWAAEEAKLLRADSTIFWLTTKDCVSPSLILRPIWQVVGWDQWLSLDGTTAPVAPVIPAGSKDEYQNSGKAKQEND